MVDRGLHRPLEYHNPQATPRVSKPWMMEYVVVLLAALLPAVDLLIIAWRMKLANTPQVYVEALYSHVALLPFEGAIVGIGGIAGVVVTIQAFRRKGRLSWVPYLALAGMVFCATALGAFIAVRFGWR